MVCFAHRYQTACHLLHKNHVDTGEVQKPLAMGASYFILILLASCTYRSTCFTVLTQISRVHPRRAPLHSKGHRELGCSAGGQTLLLSFQNRGDASSSFHFGRVGSPSPVARTVRAAAWDLDKECTQFVCPWAGLVEMFLSNLQVAAMSPVCRKLWLPAFRVSNSYMG